MLAFNIQGERFQPPASATYWRVRRLKPGGRGTPDVMFSLDGAPLMLPVETELQEFRESVRNVPGRYRLDPVDEDHKACEGGAPAYLQISKEASAPTAPAAPPSPVSGSESALIEMLVRTNTEMVKSITERFASVMDSAAILIRAADGAGLPAREPSALAAELAAAVRNAAPSAAESDSEASTEPDDEPDDDEPTAVKVVNALVEKLGPLVMPMVSAKLMNMAEKNETKSRKDQAPPSERNAVPDPSEAPRRASESRAPSPTGFVAKLLAVQALLTKEEFDFAQRSFGEMTPEARETWKDKLIAMSVEDAAAMVRAELARSKAEASGATREEAA